ncbi:MAG: ATPase domain-containing protein [Candidatus ainarchaeum sp.]|nr:ATPase domain-containing protein [Candidatus ainarchaeum sp.]
MVERIKSGIPGLDELTFGGIPKGSNILVSGGTGTGKTIFCTQYLYNGAIEYGEPGLFVTLEGNVKDISWNMENFQWDIKKLQDQNMLTIYRLNLSAIDDLETVQKRIDEQLDEIAKEIEEINAKRLVIDSTTVFGAYFNPSILRTTLFQFTDKLKTLGCTTFLTSETAPTKNVLSAYGVEEFVVDGIINLQFTPPNRSIFIRKMRGTDHDKSPHPLIINSKGISVNSKDSMLWESIK